jgi:predicted site-specific integrase-resolvase
MLENQANRLQQYCIAKGYQIHKVIKEFGSGINDNRPLLTKLLSSGDFTKIVIEHKDRLTRIGFNYIETLLKKEGKEIEVVNNAEDDKENIIQDFVSIITSYCARIYGNRRSKRKTEQLIKELEK